MKRYISSILIPCLLLQFFGCYSYRTITMDELKQYRGENNIKVVKDTTEIIINRKMGRYEQMNWNTTDSSLLINKKTLKNYADSSLVENEKMEIPYSKINATEIEEIDPVKTTFFSVVITAVVVVAVAGLLVSINGFDLGLHGNW